MHISSEQRAAGVIIGDLLDPVMEEAGGGAIRGLGRSASQRVIKERCGHTRSAGSDKHIFHVIFIVPDPVGGEVAAGVVRDGVAADPGILIKPVGDIIMIPRPPDPLIEGLGEAFTGQLVDRIKAEGGGREAGGTDVGQRPIVPHHSKMSGPRHRPPQNGR